MKKPDIELSDKWATNIIVKSDGELGDLYPNEILEAYSGMIDALIEVRSYICEYVIAEEWEQEVLEKIEQALKKAGAS